MQLLRRSKMIPVAIALVLAPSAMTAAAGGPFHSDSPSQSGAGGPERAGHHDGEASEAKGAPPGNNGTVKIDGEPFDTAPGAANRNEPHVACDFRVEFYNYEEDSTWNVTFEAWRPPGDHSESQVVVASGRANDDAFHDMDLNDDPATGASAEGIDHVEEYRLDFPDLDPHPKQGFHVKATALVDDPDPRGAEKKHKVFWVEPCDTTDVAGEEETKEEKESEQGGNSQEGKSNNEARDKPSSGGSGSQNTTPTGPAVLSQGTERSAPAAASRAQVLGTTLERPQPQASSQRLARTGTEGPLLVPFALITIALGMAATRLGRRRPERA